MKSNKEFIKNTERCTLIQLDINSVDWGSLYEMILKNDYKEPLKAKNVEYNSQDPATYFEYKWNSVDKNVRKIQFPDGSWIECVEAMASCEYSRKRKYNDQKVLLPKEKRLNIEETPVIFIKKSENIYAIILTNDDMELLRVKKLVGNSNIVQLNSNFKIESEIFEWMFYQYNSNQKIGKEIEVQSISSFKGNVLNGDNRFSGRSHLMPDLVVTKAFLSNNYPLTSIGVELMWGEIPSYLVINEVEEKELKVQIITGSGNSLMFSPESVNIKTIIYVFFSVIPFIISSYNFIKDNYTKHEKGTFKKQMGIEVIRKIMKRNNISKEDL